MTRAKSKPKVDKAPTPTVDVVFAPPAFSVGDRVHHRMFGDGKVERIRDNKLTIKFGRKLTKEIREDFVRREQRAACAGALVSGPARGH